jgi:putative methyltransferase (TIGR04325 family)
MTQLKSLIKFILPHGLIKFIERYNKKKNQQNRLPTNIVWEGDFATWKEVSQQSAGYEAANILERVKYATLKVKNGEAVYERDSFIFDKIQYNWPLLASLLSIGSNKGNTLNIIDFGGSLGSSYFQNKHILSPLFNINWVVVEQSHFVDCGRGLITNDELTFEYTIQDAKDKLKIDAVLLSGVLQNLDNPYDWLEQILSYNFEYIIIDRTAFIDDDKDRITIQKVPEEIYKASYPAWFLNESKFLQAFESNYNLIYDFNSAADSDNFLEDGKRGYRKGFLFKRITN